MLLTGRKGDHGKFVSTLNDVTFEVVLYPLYELPVVTSIDLDIAPGEGVSAEPYHSSSVSVTGRFRNLGEQ